MTSRGKSGGCMGGLPINNRDLMGVSGIYTMGFHGTSWDLYNGIQWDLIGIMYHGISLVE